MLSAEPSSLVSSLCSASVGRAAFASIMHRLSMMAQLPQTASFTLCIVSQVVLCRLIATKGTASASLTKRIFFSRLSHLFAFLHFYEKEEAFNGAHALATQRETFTFPVYHWFN